MAGMGGDTLGDNGSQQWRSKRYRSASDGGEWLTAAPLSPPSGKL